MSSPVIAQGVSTSQGRLQGKQAVGAYWVKAFALYPTLKFELICILLGVNSVVIHYYGAAQRGWLRSLALTMRGLCIEHMRITNKPPLIYQ